MMKIKFENNQTTLRSDYFDLKTKDDVHTRIQGQSLMLAIRLKVYLS